MRHESAQSDAIEPMPRQGWIAAFSIGIYFAWWNLYHDEGFLFVDSHVNQVLSCIACYGGALVACAAIDGLRKHWEGRERRWLVIILGVQLVFGGIFYGVIAARTEMAVGAVQLVLGATFFAVLFFLMRQLASLPLRQAALLIALGVGVYGALECALWAITMIAPLLPLRIVVHLVLLGSGFATAWAAIGKDDLSSEEQPPCEPATVPAQLVLHTGAYWLVFGMTHALASGVVPIGHDKLLPCYMGSIVAATLFYLVFARNEYAGKLWPKVRACIFPLTMLSFLLLPFANSGFAFVSIGFAQCAMDTYLAFYLLATLTVARKIRWCFTRTAVAAVVIAVPFVIAGVVAVDVLRLTLPLSPLLYNMLSVLTFVLLVAGTFWVGDDRRADLVWGLEKKLTPKRFEDKETAERCAKAAEKFGLTKREGEILLALAQGQNAAAIAEAEVISLNTARTHISRIHRKMDVHNQQELQKRLKEL